MENHILSALPPKELESFLPYLQTVDLPSNAVLFDSDDAINRVYFPYKAMVSLVSVMEDGTTVETAMIGREGMVGADAVLGGEVTISRHIVQVPGSAACMEFSHFRRAVKQSTVFQSLLSASAQALLAQALQSVACNRLHSVEERCCRWLLTACDRSGNDSFALTHEALAGMLGVRRAGISVVAGRLQRAGLIHYRRGTVTILDRSGLEAAACECYGALQRVYRRLLPIAT